MQEVILIGAVLRQQNLNNTTAPLVNKNQTGINLKPKSSINIDDNYGNHGVAEQDLVLNTCSMKLQILNQWLI